MQKNKQQDNLELKDGGVDWWTRILLRVAPRYGLRRLIRRGGTDDRRVRALHEGFVGAEHVDIVPLGGGERGFQIIVDRQIALYFYQDGDSFSYDGFEVGQYEPGNVTIFD